MRQAFVIKNPKWELFTTASDAFKAAEPPCVLVVRGRCKEKKTVKSILKPEIKTIKKTAAMAALCLLSALSSIAGDVTAYLSTTTIANSTTNTTGSRAAIGWKLNDILAWQCAVLSTNNAHATTKSNVYIRINESLNGTDIQTNAYVLTIQTATYQTNANNTIGRLTNTSGSKWLYLGDIENANTNYVFLRRLFIEKAN